MHEQFVNTKWGVKPVLFHIGNLSVSSYPVFVFMGLLAGSLVYFWGARKERDLNDNSFFIVVGSLVGALAGAKIFEIIINLDRISSHSVLQVVLTGKTIIGGFLGGVIGSVTVKRVLKIKTRKGNLFAPSIAIGLAIGRIGCFLNGCCYGKPTNLPWAINFGDGIGRHPTQLYESLFMFIVFISLIILKRNFTFKPGKLFYLLLTIYLIFRFLIEFIREERVAFWGFSYFQLISVIALIYLILKEKYLTPKTNSNV